MARSKRPGSNMPNKLRNAPPSLSAVAPTAEPDPYIEWLPDQAKLAALDHDELRQLAAHNAIDAMRRKASPTNSTKERNECAADVARWFDRLLLVDKHVGKAGVQAAKKLADRLDEHEAKVRGSKPARNRVPRVSQENKQVH